MSFQRQLFPAVLGIAAVCSAGSAVAATDTSTFQVLLTLTATCDVHTTAPTDMDFGTAGLLDTAIDQTSTITVLCSDGTAYDVGIDAGANELTANDVNTRRMVNGTTNFVGYQLYQDASRSVVWGNTVGTDTLAGTGNGSNQALTVYGRVPVQATPAAGAYADTVVVTVTY